MRRATLLAAPSLTARDGDAEGLPNVVVEAAASGLPVVATRHSGIPEAVEDGETGFLVREGDAGRACRADRGAARVRGPAGGNGLRGAARWRRNGSTGPGRPSGSRRSTTRWRDWAEASRYEIVIASVASNPVQPGVHWLPSLRSSQ